MVAEFVFVGERPSNRAKEMNVTWSDGHLAAKQLFDALRDCDVDPSEQLFMNLFIDSADVVNEEAFEQLRVFQLTASYITIIALGRKVEKELLKLGVPHKFMTHPAARGLIRRKDRYAKHVREVLER